MACNIIELYVSYTFVEYFLQTYFLRIVDFDDLGNYPIIHWWKSTSWWRLQLELEWLKIKLESLNIGSKHFNKLHIYTYTRVLNVKLNTVLN
jgi:hypothetical protein